MNWKVTTYQPGNGLGGMSVLRGLTEQEAIECAARINAQKTSGTAYAAPDNDPPLSQGTLRHTKSGWKRR